MRFRVVEITLAIISLTVHCAMADAGRSAEGKRIAVPVRAVVVEYMRDAMHDRFDDGSFATYDATKVQVVEPVQLAGRKLVFYHERTMPLESPWRAKGRTLRFDIDEHLLLDRKMVLFSAAAEKVGLVDPPCVHSMQGR